MELYICNKRETVQENDVAVLITPSHVTLIHSIENAENGSMPGFVCVCVCSYTCIYVCV